MSKPLTSVVRVATTPEQAKVLVALLQAEGIPAHVDGDGLADEFAMSRRLMNLVATRVVVPTASLDAAREILGDVDIAPDELERQALAAGEPAAEPPPAPQPASMNWTFPLLCAIGAIGGGAYVALELLR